MASIALSDLWVSLASDPSTATRWPLQTLRVVPEKPGSVRRYAGGRFRSVTRAGSQIAMEVTLGLVDRETVRLIEQWQGRPVLVRDPTGRRFYAVYFSSSVDERGDGTGTADVSVSLLQVSHAEGV